MKLKIEWLCFGIDSERQGHDDKMPHANCPTERVAFSYSHIEEPRRLEKFYAIMRFEENG